MSPTSLTITQRTKASPGKVASKTFCLALEAFSQSFRCNCGNSITQIRYISVNVKETLKSELHFPNIYRDICSFLVLLQKLHEPYAVFVVLQWVKTWLPQRWWAVLPSCDMHHVPNVFHLFFHVLLLVFLSFPLFLVSTEPLTWMPGLLSASSYSTGVWSLLTAVLDYLGWKTWNNWWKPLILVKGNSYGNIF